MNCRNCDNDNMENETHCGLCRRPTRRDLSGKHTPALVAVNGAEPFWDPEAIVVGRSQVKVFRREESGKTRMCHEGIVIQRNTHFVRVYNPLTPDAGGDLSPEMAQLFPIKSDGCWVELIGQKEGDAVKTPPLFL